MKLSPSDLSLVLKAVQAKRIADAMHQFVLQHIEETYPEIREGDWDIAEDGTLLPKEVETCQP